MSQRRLSDMLFHRGITGVLIASHGEANEELSGIDWSRLSAVKIGCFPHAPALHRVTDDHSAMARLAMRRILTAGFERVGLVMTQWWDDFADQAWSAGFLIEQSHLAAESRIPFLSLTGTREDWTSGQPAERYSAETSALAKWYDEYRPDVILSFSPMVLRQLKHLGLVVPQDVGYVDLCLESSDGSGAGFRQNSESVGELAVATLIAQLQQNSVGIPRVATTTLVGGMWTDGVSLPALRLPEHWAAVDKSCPSTATAVSA